MAPERRRRVDGKAHPFDDGSVPERFRQLYFGRPQHHFSREHLEALYESQTAYLYRHRLLTAVERRALDVGATPREERPTLSLQEVKTWWEES